MHARQPEPLAAQIERQILLDAELVVIVEDEGEQLRLTGLVDSSAARQAAEDIAQAMAPRCRIQNDLEIEDVWPYESGDTTPETLGGRENLDSSDMGDEVDPNFTDQALFSDPNEAAGPSSSLDEDLVSEGDLVYFPPTDPVVTVNEQGAAEILGGFAGTSSDDVDVEPSALDSRPGDEALADAIRRELREDASTTALELEVVVRNGVAHLTGRVSDIQDAENAEAVARTVPGLVDVEETIEVAAL